MDKQLPALHTCPFSGVVSPFGQLGSLKDLYNYKYTFLLERK
jgi:hypothetical protein